jgi:cardiolipin synthase (CMP-forming)
MKRSVITIPNLLTLMRALGIPLFLYLYINQKNVVASFWVLGFAALTDYLDGKIARALKQESAFGAAFDPAIDRAYILAVALTLAYFHLVSGIIIAILFARDLILGLLLTWVKQKGGSLFSVSYLGKAATFNLLYALPLLLIPHSGPSAFSAGNLTHSLALAFTSWGIVLYLYSGLGYFLTGMRNLVR